jgi:hypothetical protein
VGRPSGSKGSSIKAKGTDYEKWSSTELSTMVSWFKRPGDSKILSGKSKLVARYLLTCNRDENDRSRLKPGEEPVVDNDNMNNNQMEMNDIQMEPV